MEVDKKMNDPIHHLRVLHNNPFILKVAFTSFYAALGEKERSFLLGYLVLPMSLHRPSRAFLQKANSRSSLRTMLRNREHIQGLEKRMAAYHKITSTTIQYLADIGEISIKDKLAVAVFNNQSIDCPSPAGVIKAASRLGVFFQPYDVPTVFRMLGVMSL